MKDLKDLYSPSVEEPALVDVPALSFLMLDGSGDPNTSPEYQEAIQALYGLSYGLKFALKKGPAGLDYAVMPLEGLWWAGDMATFTSGPRDDWRWTMMIAQPEAVTPEFFQQVRDEAVRKKGLAALAKVRLEAFHEGLSAQIMHVGPFSAEGPTIQRLHQFIAEQGYAPAGKHHEIYLSDPRRSAPEKMKTVIRQPVRPPA